MDVSDAGSFVRYFDRVRERTLRVARLIPPDRVEWSHHDGAFTLGDLVRHLAATERHMFGENVQGLPSRYPGYGTELAQGLDGILDYMERMHTETVEILSRLSTDDLQRRCPTPGGVTLPVWKWLRAMVEHEVHHRGQLYTMLGILGVPTPPLYGLTERQVFENSQSLEGP